MRSLTFTTINSTDCRWRADRAEAMVNVAPANAERINAMGAAAGPGESRG